MRLRNARRMVSGLAKPQLDATRDTLASFTGSNPYVFNTPLDVSSHAALITGIFIVAVGAMVGAVGSGFAVRRFLSV